MSSTSSTEQPTSTTPMGLIVVAWTLVGVPLAYGLFNTVKAASALFGG
jgi:hypothetical protein